MLPSPSRSTKKWVFVAVAGAIVVLVVKSYHPKADAKTGSPHGQAATQLTKLSTKPDSAIAGYSRARFGPAWADVDHNHCDTRNDVLARDLTGIRRSGSCIVLSGTLHDPYSGQTIHFTRGVKTSDLVQIDHVVPLGDAWISGAKGWTAAKREQLGNDPLNLLAVDAHNNEAKGDHTAAVWLPPYKAEQCRYVAIQIAVKTKYKLTISPAEHTAMKRVLATCPGQDATHG